MYIMIKRSISFALAYFVVRSFFDFVRGEEINWVNTIGSSFAIFIFTWFILWAKIPYKWNKNKVKH